MNYDRAGTIVPNRTRRHVWSGFLPLVAGAALLVAPAPVPAASPPGGEGDPPSAIEDDARLLTDSQRAALERLLQSKTSESGSPLSVLVIAHVGGHQRIDELARRVFADRRLDRAGPPRVLLVVAAREHEAAIETGQGPAGIVPEIDARRIVLGLQSALARHRLAAGLEDAVVAITASARATADRRRPLPPEPLEATRPTPRGASTDVEPGLDGAGVGAKPDAPPARPVGSTRGSLMPAAYVLAGIAVLALALRRRRRLAQDRDTQAKRPVPERKAGATDVKSIGDRPMS